MLKRFIGPIAIILGVVVVLFTSYQQKRLASAQSDVSTGESLFSENKVASFVGDSIEKKLHTYDRPLQLLRIGGMVLIGLGAGITLLGFCRSRQK